MESPLRVLLIDDDRDDYVLTRELLRDAFGAGTELEWSGSYEAGLDSLTTRKFDVCLLDYRLGAKTGLDMLAEAIATNVETPIILLTGQGQREIDMQAMQAGAADYLTKDLLQPGILERAIRHALERHRDRKALKQLNDLLESRVEQRTRELAEANDALKQADQRKDEFLAVLAHELRNPLAPIMNSLTLLNLASDDAETCTQARATMERQLRQLIRLTDDLFEVSRISRGKIELRKQPIDLRSVVQQAVEAARPLCERRNQSLSVAVPEHSVELTADPARLAQVVGNLLNNAMKFTPPRGTVSLTLAADKGHAEIRVRDNGIGIAREQIGRIFEMFAQAGPPLDKSDAGLGIGLTLVQNLVAMHGGTVQAISEGIGRGSEFIVRLPTAAATVAAPQEAKPKSSAGALHRRILLVDDNRDAAISLARLLQISGHETTVAFNATTALEHAKSIWPEIALLDIGLPDISGYEVAKQLRALADGRPIVLIALTGWGQEADRQKSREAGFDKHLVKPVEFPELTRILNELK